LKTKPWHYLSSNRKQFLDVLGITTAMTGTFGMNLVSGLEGSHSAFIFVSGLSAMTALGMASYFRRLVSGKVIQRRAEMRIERIQTMTNALSDLTALDYTVKKIMSSGRRLDRDEFKKELRMARISRKVTDAEVDLLFNALNTNDDGFLDHTDFDVDESEEMKTKG
jgi:hypothetical protein